MKITGNIITLNEEKNIEECISSLQRVCDEIFVIDSGSTDKTVEIANELGAKVITQSYLGDGPQKNLVIKYANNDWILSIDADERLDEDMIQSIKNLTIDEINNYNSFSFKRKNFIGDRWIKHCGWYPDECIRLYNKKLCQFKNVLGHSYIESTKNFVLPGHIIHYSFADYHELFYKANRFSTRGANMFLNKNKKISSYTPFFHGLSAFLKKYFIKKGFLDGLDGLTISISSAVNSYLKYAKYIEKQKENKSLTNIWE